MRQAQPYHRYLQMLLLAGAGTGCNFARAAVSPLQEAIRHSLALSDNEMSILQGFALALPVVIGAVPIGLLVDRCSRVRLLCVFTGLQLLGTILTAFATGFTTIFAARCLVGLAATATAITAPSLIADLFRPDERGRATTVLSIGMLGGSSAAFALGGALLEGGHGADAWRTAMLWLSSPFIVIIGLTLAMREPPRIGIELERATPRAALRELLRYRAVVIPLIAGTVMVAIADGAALVWAAPAFIREFGLSAGHVGAIMAATLMISGIVGPIAGGAAADHCHRSGGVRRTSAVLGLLCLASIPAGAFSLAANIWWASIMLTLFITIGAMTGVMLTALFTVVIPNELRGLCTAIKSANGTIFGIGLAPLLVSILADRTDAGRSLGLALAIVCVAGSAVGAAVFLSGRRHFSTPPHGVRWAI